MSSFSTSQRGRGFVCMKIVQAAGAGEPGYLYARQRWGINGDTIAKAAVAALTSGDMGTVEGMEFFGLVRERSVIGAMSGLRNVPFDIRVVRRTNGTRGVWVGEAAPIPLNKPSLAGSSLPPLRVAAIIVSTKESLSAAGDTVEDGVKQDLEIGCTGATDAAFLDASNAGTPNVSPASVTHGAPTIQATGDAAADLKALVSNFAGDLSSAYLVTDPATATGLAMVRGNNGAFLFPDAGPRGGAVLGIPLLTSRESPRDSGGGQIALIDPTGIAVAMEGLQLDIAEETSLAMSDSPSSPAQMVSLFETNSIAWRCIIAANWEVQRAGCVTVLTGVDY